MGIFRKKKADNTQLDSLRTELESMRERLDGADRSNAELATRLTTLDQSSADFAQRLEKVDDLSVHVQELSEKADAAAQAEPQALLLSTPTPPPPPPADDTAASTIDEGKLDEIASRLEELSVTVAAHYTELSAGREQMDAVDDLNERFGEIAEQISTIDLRVTNVSFELANQLTELSRDIEAVSEQRSASAEQPSIIPTGAIDERIEDQIDSALDEVRESTEKLAAEQARFDTDYLKLGATALQQWGLPEEFAAIMHRIRTPEKVVESPLRILPLIVAIGRSVAEGIFEPPGYGSYAMYDDNGRPMLLEKLAESRHLDVEAMDDFLNSRRDAVEQYAQSMIQ